MNVSINQSTNQPIISRLCVSSSKKVFAVRGQMSQRSSGIPQAQTPKKTYKSSASPSPSLPPSLPPNLPSSLRPPPCLSL